MMIFEKNPDERKHRGHKSLVWRIRLAKSCIKGQVNQSLADLWLINTIFTCYITKKNHVSDVIAMTNKLLVNFRKVVLGSSHFDGQIYPFTV